MMKNNTRILIAMKKNLNTPTQDVKRSDPKLQKQKFSI